MEEKEEIEGGRKTLSDYLTSLNGAYAFMLDENLAELSPLIINALDALKENPIERGYALKHFKYDISNKELDDLWNGRFTEKELAEKIHHVASSLYKRAN